jgi:aldose 1-epimerase
MKPLKRYFYYILLLALGINLSQCKNVTKEQSTETAVPVKEQIIITKSQFGIMPDSTVVEKYTLKNNNGVEMEVITFGGRITSLKVPNKDGKLENVVLGFNNLEDYLRPDDPYFGALIGRYGNRIAKGKFSLNGEEYSLAKNNGANHLHGGVIGFDRVVWEVTPMESENGPSLKLKYLSKDGEEGYPGNLKVTVVYTLTDENNLEVSYEATTDKTTIVNLTQHAYFNLSGDFSKPILDHEITINADNYVPVDDTLIPIGELADVTNTPFDFRTAKSIGRDIENKNDQLVKGKGFDHCWVLNEQDKGIRWAASVFQPESGRLLEIYTDQPGIQFYTGNFLDATLPMPNGGTYAYRTGFCLETQHYPDSPNQKDFPSVVLNPGETYKSKTIFKFLVK